MANRKETSLQLPGGVFILPIKTNYYQTQERTVSFTKIIDFLRKDGSRFTGTTDYDFGINLNSLLGVAHHDLANRALKGFSSGIFHEVPDFLRYIADEWLNDLKKGEKYEKMLGQKLTHPQLKIGLKDQVVPDAIRHFTAFQSFGLAPRVMESKFGYYIRGPKRPQGDGKFIPDYRVPITGVIDHFVYKNGIPQVWELKSNASEFRPEYALQLATYLTGIKLMDPSLAFRKTDEEWEGYPDPQAFVYDLGSSRWYQVFFNSRIYATLAQIYQYGHLTLLNGYKKDFSGSGWKGKVTVDEKEYDLSECHQRAVTLFQRLPNLYRVVEHPRAISDKDLKTILKKYPHKFPDVATENHQGFLF